MRFKEYDKKTLSMLHSVQLEILDEFVRVCKKNNLNYFLCGGTLLGAVRHQGFIPWDDDIDVGMPRKDYDEFIKLCKTDLSKDYMLDCFETNKDYYLPFAKVRKNNTIFDEESNHHLHNHKGIFIDIFPHENANNQKSITQKIQAVIVKSISEAMYVKKKIKKLKNVRRPWFISLFCLFNGRFLMRVQRYFMRLNKNNNSKYLSALADTLGYIECTSPREVFLPTKDIVFENKTYNGMNNNDYYLTRMYGDYMVLPPKEKRVNHMPLKISFDTSKNRSEKSYE